MPDEPTVHLDLRAVSGWSTCAAGRKKAWVVSRDLDSLNSVFTKIIHLHNLKLHFYRDLEEKQVKAAKRNGNWVQAKYAAAKEKNDANGKVEASKKWMDYSVEFQLPEPTKLTPSLIATC